MTSPFSPGTSVEVDATTDAQIVTIPGNGPQLYYHNHSGHRAIINGLSVPNNGYGIITVGTNTITVSTASGNGTVHLTRGWGT